MKTSNNKKAKEIMIETSMKMNNDVNIEVTKKTSKKKADINNLVAYTLLNARKKVGISQVELAKRTGIDQADISKLERGLSNPSVLTLSRLAEAMDMKLSIIFEEDDNKE